MRAAIRETDGDMNVSPEVKADLVKRLKRLEGQVRGVQRMLDEQRECREILQQLAAIRSAAHQASLVLVREHAAACLFKTGETPSPQEVLDSLVSVLERV
jgi:CsoR family transcriptional regulator, copper-sensing transcriptional repressor